MKRWLCASVAALCLTPSAAQGQRQATFVTACASTDAEERLQAVLCAELSATALNTQDIRVSQEDNLLNSGAELSPRALLSDTRELLETVRSHLEAGRPDDAREASATVVDTLLTLEPWLGTREILRDALVLTVRVAVAAKDRVDALHKAVRALTLAPALQRTWRDSIQDTVLREVFRDAQTQLDALPKTATLDAQCVEDHAEVFLDGVLVGVTPLRVHGISPGEHLIRIRKRGYVPIATLVRFSPGLGSAVDADLEEARDFRAWEQLQGSLSGEIGDARAGPSLKELGALLIAERIIALRAQPVAGGTKLSAYLYDLRSGQLLTQASRTLTSQGPMARREAIRSLLSTLLNLAIPTIAEESSDEEIYQQWWFWTGLGTVATAAAVTLAIVFTADAPPKPTGKGAIEIRP
jgi:hypothetical protein